MSLLYSYVIINTDAGTPLPLQTLLEEHQGLRCAQETGSVNDGLNAILKHEPQLVFMNLDADTEALFKMVLEMHQYLVGLPKIIGVSTTKAHAYEALKNGFFDYWLRPFQELDIRKGISKIRKSVPVPETVETLCLKSYKDYHYLDTKEILYLKADNNTTEFFMKDGRVVNAYKTLKSFEGQLPKNFIRIHQSYIVNTHYITRINFGRSMCGLKSVSDPLPFSRSHKEKLQKLKELKTAGSLLHLN
ncbi:LytR/AlgR family response regulator transcription factor [Maribacter sp. 2307ULW6-5]|uniref:LytR/AlgR family response regulator transcription factor n=1 Tax=Maribacter sp. 2307ULW6-5 TaxID=3386275 RepID=UPI0039BD203B